MLILIAKPLLGPMAQSLQARYTRIVDHGRRTAQQAQGVRIRRKQMPLHHLVIDVARVVGPGYEPRVPRSRHPFEGSMWQGAQDTRFLT